MLLTPPKTEPLAAWIGADNTTLKLKLVVQKKNQKTFASTSLPLYQTLASDLELHIRRGKWKAGERLPTELELTQTHQMSRPTVRHALDILRSKRLIETFPNRGSVVLDQNLLIGVRSIDSIGEIVRLGQETQTEVLEWRAVELAGEMQEFFGPQQRTVYRLVGIRRLAGVPVYLIRSHVAEELGRKIAPNELSTQTPIEIIKDVLHIPVVHATEEVWAERADSMLAEQLQVPRDSMVIVEEMRLYGKRAVPLQLATAWWRPDQYRRRYKVTR